MQSEATKLTLAIKLHDKRAGEATTITCAENAHEQEHERNRSPVQLPQPHICSCNSAVNPPDSTKEFVQVIREKDFSVCAHACGLLPGQQSCMMRRRLCPPAAIYAIAQRMCTVQFQFRDETSCSLFPPGRHAI